MDSEDVTKVTKKRINIYAICNFMCFLVELTIFAVVQWVDEIRSVRIINWKSLDANNSSLPLIPMQMQAEVLTLGWLAVFLCQGIFVLRGLPCLKPGQHYVNCLLLKIRFYFCLFCLTLTASIFAFATLYQLSNIVILIIPVSFFIALKCKFE